MKQTIAAICVLLTLTAMWFWLSGRTYPEVSSPESLRLIKALYTACSSQSQQRLTSVEQEVIKTHSAGKLGDGERDAFARIIQQAQIGDWSRATSESYRFAQDQVR